MKSPEPWISFSFGTKTASDLLSLCLVCLSKPKLPFPKSLPCHSFPHFSILPSVLNPRLIHSSVLFIPSSCRSLNHRSVPLRRANSHILTPRTRVVCVTWHQRWLNHLHRLLSFTNIWNQRKTGRYLLVQSYLLYSFGHDKVDMTRFWTLRVH